jgi:hypothetical protein
MIELTNQNTEWGNNELAEPSGKDRFWHKTDHLTELKVR